MKKLCIVLLSLLVATNVFAEGIGLKLDIGGHYSSAQLHYFRSVNKETQFSIHEAHLKNMGGFHVDLKYLLGKNWTLFFNTAFSFNRTFTSDNLIGAGYTFDVGKAFDVFFGLGFAFGGAVHSSTTLGTTISHKYFTMGAGFDLACYFMFTNPVGMYLGVEGCFYGVPSGKKKTVTGSSVSTTKMDKSLLPSMAMSLLGKVGLRIAF